MGSCNLLSNDSLGKINQFYERDGIAKRSAYIENLVPKMTRDEDAFVILPVLRVRLTTVPTPGPRGSRGELVADTLDS